MIIINKYSGQARKILNISSLCSTRSFSIDSREIHKLTESIRTKLNVIKSMTTLRKFNYDPPKMHYDKEAGEVKMEPRPKRKAKKFIRNLDELEREKKALLDEVGLDENLLSKEEINDE
jgi:hypothetical protein